MSKRKNKKFTLDFDFEATVVDTNADPFLEYNSGNTTASGSNSNQNSESTQQPPLPPQKTQQEIDAEEEAERRRRIRMRQQQMQQQGREPNSFMPTITAVPNQTQPIQAQLDMANSLSQNPQQQQQQQQQQPLVASIHDMNRYNGQEDENEDEDDDDSSEDDGPVLTFISAKKRQALIKKTIQTTSKSVNLRDDLETMNIISSATVQQSVEDVRKEKMIAKMLNTDGLPDDTDHLDETQIDVMMWREREAKRLISEVQELMRHLDFR